MKFKFRKRIKIAPGIRINISKSGISTSIGRPGATINLSKRGTRVSAGIPGTGISTTKVYKREPENNEDITPHQTAPEIEQNNKLKIFGWVLAILFLTAALKSCFTTGKTADTHTLASEEPEVITQNTEDADELPPSPTVKTLYVSPPILNVRNAPNGKIIGTINQGMPIIIYEEHDGWNRISPDNDTEEWVASQYLCTQTDCSDAK